MDKRKEQEIEHLLQDKLPQDMAECIISSKNTINMTEPEQIKKAFRDLSYQVEELLTRGYGYNGREAQHLVDHVLEYYPETTKRMLEDGRNQRYDMKAGEVLLSTKSMVSSRLEDKEEETIKQVANRALLQSREILDAPVRDSNQKDLDVVLEYRVEELLKRELKQNFRSKLGHSDFAEMGATTIGKLIDSKLFPEVLKIYKENNQEIDQQAMHKIQSCIEEYEQKAIKMNTKDEYQKETSKELNQFAENAFAASLASFTNSPEETAKQHLEKEEQNEEKERSPWALPDHIID